MFAVCASQPDPYEGAEEVQAGSCFGSDATPISRGAQNEVAQLRAELEGHKKRLQDLELSLKEAGGSKLDLSVGRHILKDEDPSLPKPQGKDKSQLEPLQLDLENGDAAFALEKSPLNRCVSTNSRTFLKSPEQDGDARKSGAGAALESPVPWSLRQSDEGMFDQDFVKAIYDKPLSKRRRKGAAIGAGVLGLMSMPFGPIGMVAGGSFGAMIGGAVGFCMDRNKVREKMKESELQKRKLRSLVRWALNHFHEEDTFVKVIEMVTLEFKPIADIADGSKHARKTLKLLDAWIGQKKVTRSLWVYMDSLLLRWHDLNRADFLRSLLVFQTLTIMYHHSQRVLDEQEVQFLHRMERLLEHESVQLIMSHAQLYPTEGETRLMECMVYADNARKRHGNAKRRGDASPKPDQEESESDEESLLSHYTAKGTFLGYGPQDGLATPTKQPSLDGGDLLESPKAARPPVVLKPPFFKSYNDFMDFDNTFKHKMPITLSEFGLLQQKADEPLKGWEVCVDRPEIKVAKIQNDTGCITLRAWATVPGVDLNVAFHIFTNNKERVKWDKVFAVMEVIDPNVQGSSILYSLMKVPLVTARDFLQYRRIRVMEDGSILIVLRSAEHPDMPEQKNAIRAESFIAGYILRQTFVGDEPVLNIFLMTCVDIKGLIPKWIINAAAPRKPAEWIESLKMASVGYMKANPDFKDKLSMELDEYRKENPYDYEDDLPESPD